MSRLAIILGPSGGGKSMSAMTLPPKETILIRTRNKDFPIMNWKSIYSEGKNLLTVHPNNWSQAKSAASRIVKIMKMASAKAKHVKYIVLDDFQYLMSNEFFADTKAGSTGWSRFDDVGMNAIDVFNTASSLRDDITVFITAHVEYVKNEVTEEWMVRLKTVGRLFEEKFTAEGVVTTTLITDPSFDEKTGIVDEYRFRTKPKAGEPTKAPPGMFPLYIPNDLHKVALRMNEYYDHGIPLDKSSAYEEESL